MYSTTRGAGFAESEKALAGNGTAYYIVLKRCYALSVWAISHFWMVEMKNYYSGYKFRSKYLFICDLWPVCAQNQARTLRHNDLRGFYENGVDNFDMKNGKHQKTLVTCCFYMDPEGSPLSTLRA